MSVTKSDDPAFPVVGGSCFLGMTMLEWYAGQAIAGAIRWNTPPEEMAKDAFELARSMIAEGAKQRDQ